MKSMNVFRRVLFVLFTFAFAGFVLNGCGYKPSSYYAKKELAGKVFVKLFIDLKDPRNAVLVKDTVDKLLIQKLDSKLVYDESLADTIMNLKIDSVDMNVLQYDKDGYNKVYRAVVKIKVDYLKKLTNKRNSFTVDGEHNFSVDDGTTISDTKRFEAIRNASDDALDEILSKIAVQSFKK